MVIIWDDVKARINEQKHGVTFEEAAMALMDPNAQTYCDSSENNEDRFLTIGHSVSRRILLVVWSEKETEKIRIISARRATKGERRIYEEGI